MGPVLYLYIYTVAERLRLIPIAQFKFHVKDMHADKDKKFELEYEVCSGHAFPFTFISLFGIVFIFSPLATRGWHHVRLPR